MGQYHPSSHPRLQARPCSNLKQDPTTADQGVNGTLIYSLYYCVDVSFAPMHTGFPTSLSTLSPSNVAPTYHQRACDNSQDSHRYDYGRWHLHAQPYLDRHGG